MTAIEFILFLGIILLFAIDGYRIYDLQKQVNDLNKRLKAIEEEEIIAFIPDE